jgi:hypothetical protein
MAIMEYKLTRELRFTFYVESNSDEDMIKFVREEIYPLFDEVISNFRNIGIEIEDDPYNRLSNEFALAEDELRA